MAFDVAENESILFGGVGGAANDYTTLNATWSLRNGYWTNLSRNLSTAPSPRSAAAMAYDIPDQELVLFGGEAPPSYPPTAPVALSDTWIFHGGRWSNITGTTGGAPLARYGAAMTYDSADKEILLFGGVTGWTGFHNDTWAFHNGTWHNVTKLSRTSPSVFTGVQLAYDSSDAYVLLYGGFTRTGASNQTWRYLAGNWSALAPPTNPGPRVEGALVDDPTTSGVVLLLGDNQTTLANASRVWTFTGGNWSASSSATAPSPRVELQACFDPNGPAVVVYGGSSQGSYNVAANDLWDLVGGAWTQIGADRFPPANGDPKVVYDAHDHEYLLLIGNQTWVSSDGNWSRIFPAVSPSSRSAESVAYDWADGYVLLFGGANATTSFGDTWTFSNGSWTKLNPKSSPYARSDASMGFDAADGYVVLFGGYLGFSDTWKFLAGAWTQLSVSGPSARAGAAFAYDSTDQEMVLYGGAPRYGPWPASDTWTFVGGKWTNISSTVAIGPPPVAYAGLTNDSFSGALTLADGQGALIGCCNETWEFLDGHWFAETPTWGPVARSLPGFASGEVCNGSILYGGSGSGLEVLGDTWIFHGRALLLIRSFTASPLRPLEDVTNVTFATDALATRGNLTYLYSGLPAGCRSANNSSISCIPTVEGSFLVTVTVTNLTWNLRATSTLTLRVGGPLTYGGFVADPSELDLGQSFALSVNVTGGFPPLTYAYVGLPTPCATSNADNLTCTPGAAGVFAIEVFVNDSGSDHLVEGLNATVNPALSVSSIVGAPSATDVGANFTVGVTISGGTSPISTTFSGLPTGCLPTGPSSQRCTPTSPGAYLLRVTVNDSAGVSVTRTQAVSVNPSLSLLAFSASPTAVSIGGSTEISASITGGSSPFSFAYSGLPPGCVAYNQSSFGCLPSQVGNYSLTVSVTDTIGAAVSGTTNLTVSPEILPLVATFAVAPGEIELGDSVLLTVTASGGLAPYAYSYFGTPTGCAAVDAATWNCTPTAVGNFSMTADVKDTRGDIASTSGALRVVAALTIRSFAPTPGTLVLGDRLVLTGTVAGGIPPYAYTYSGLPPGCVPADGPTINCAPSTSGSYVSQLSVSDATGHTARANASITVTNPIPILPGNSTANTSGSPPGWELAAVAVAAVGLAAVVLTVYVLRRRRDPPDASQ